MADIGYSGCDLSDIRGVDSLVGDDLKPCQNRLPIAGAPLGRCSPPELLRPVKAETSEQRFTLERCVVYL